MISVKEKVKLVNKQVISVSENWYRQKQIDISASEMMISASKKWSQPEKMISDSKKEILSLKAFSARKVYQIKLDSPLTGEDIKTFFVSIITKT